MQIGKLVQEGAITIKTGPFGTQLKAAEYQETGIPVLNVKNLGYGTVNSAKLDHVGADTVERLRIHLLQQGDIVFGRKGAVDRHAYIDNESDGWMQGSDCIRLRVETDDINPRFLSYYFLTNQHKAFMISMCSHGTTMASLNQKILEQIDFPCLERNYQDNINNNYDELITNKNINTIDSNTNLEGTSNFIYISNNESNNNNNSNPEKLNSNEKNNGLSSLAQAGKNVIELTGENEMIPIINNNIKNEDDKLDINKLDVINEERKNEENKY